jgi:hypothetical protein
MSFELPIPHSGDRTGALLSRQPPVSGGFVPVLRRSARNSGCCKPTVPNHLPSFETANKCCWLIFVCVAWRCAWGKRAQQIRNTVTGQGPTTAPRWDETKTLDPGQPGNKNAVLFMYRVRSPVRSGRDWATGKGTDASENYFGRCRVLGGDDWLAI